MTAGAMRYTSLAGAPANSTRRGLDLSGETLELVRRQRARGTGWQAIARMVGCSEHDLRVGCDPTYAPPAMLVRRHDPAETTPPATPREKAISARPARGQWPWRQRDAVLLALAEEPWSLGAARRTGLTTVVVGVCCQRLEAAELLIPRYRRRGAPAGWVVTAQGEREIARLRLARGEGGDA